MRRGIGGLRRTLVAAIGTAIGALILAVMLLEEPLVQHRLTELASESLNDAIDTVHERMEGGADAREAAFATAAELGVSIKVYQSGMLRADSSRPDRLHEERFDEEPSGRVEPEGDGHMLIGVRDGVVVRAWRQQADLQRVHATVRELLVIGGAMALLVAISLTIVLGRALVEPARELTEVADALARGDLTARAMSERDDELGAIGRALDRMADQLAERIGRLRSEQDRLRTVLNSMVEAVFVTDSLGRIEQTNFALDALVGGDSVGRTPLEALGSEALHEAVRVARRGKAQEVELQISSEQGRRTLRAVLASLPDQAGVVAVLHDLTQLAEAARIRRDFVANASHELRTPLTAIRGFAETLRDGALDDREAAQRFVEVILKHALRLQALADDLTALARAEAVGSPSDLTSVDVARVAREAIQGLAKLAESQETRLALDLSEGLFAMANPRSLDQVLVNLIDNALKYSPADATVTVRAKRVSGFGLDAVAQVPGQGEAIVVEVHNTGPGIDPKHLTRIFERFYRVDTGRSREVGGTGLGLAIVKHLCTGMGAAISVKSPPGKGVTFTIRLRASPDATEADEADEADETDEA